MDKRRLAKIPRKDASDEMLQMAGRLTAEQIATVEMVSEDVLMMTIYPVESLMDGQKGARFRTFMTKADYITQDLTAQKTKWITSSFRHMSEWGYGYEYSGGTVHLWETRWRDGNWHYDSKTFFWTDKDLELLRNFTSEFAKPEDKDVWASVMRFQSVVMKRRLEKRHRKETDPIDQLMETVQEIPKGFEEWATETAMGFSRYLIYSPTGKKNQAVAKCTYCGRTAFIDRTEVRLRNNEKGHCPVCGSAVTYKAKGNMAFRIDDERFLALVEPTEDGFLWRSFLMHRRIDRGTLISEDRLREVKRDFCTFGDNNKMSVQSYEYRDYKQTGKTRWCPYEGYICADWCLLYPDNLPQAWKHTPFKYSALEILSRNNPGISAKYTAFGIYQHHPELEWFIKMGLYKLAMEMLEGSFYGSYRRPLLNEDGNTIFEILRLTKENTRTLQAMDGDSKALWLLQEAQESGYNLKANDLEKFRKIFGCNTALIRKENRNASIHKICRYIEKESANYPIGDNGACWQYACNNLKERPDIRIERMQNCGHDWLDYIGWCRELKYDLTNMFFYFPKNFRKVHDRVQKEYQDLKDRQAARKRRREEAEAKRQMELTRKAMAEIFKENDGVDAFHIKGKGLILVVPKDAEAIKDEGAALHHCVGTYVERVAKGKTNIFFVRKEKEPEKPYFTMEFQNGKVIQCRGSHNCGMPADVKAFVNAFEAKMNEQVGTMERRCG